VTDRFLRAFALLALLAGCTSPADEGEPCVDTSDCRGNLACFEHVGAEEPKVCMEICDASTTWICESGLVCLPLTAGRGACYLGGTLPVGSSCLDRGLECEPGAVCVNFDDGDEERAQCFKACRPDAADCGADETCTLLAMEGTLARGFCEPAAP
jgi:hypothetical protein